MFVVDVLQIYDLFTRFDHDIGARLPALLLDIFSQVLDLILLNFVFSRRHEVYLTLGVTHLADIRCGRHINDVALFFL